MAPRFICSDHQTFVLLLFSPALQKYIEAKTETLASVFNPSRMARQKGTTAAGGVIAPCAQPRTFFPALARCRILRHHCRGNPMQDMNRWYHRSTTCKIIPPRRVHRGSGMIGEEALLYKGTIKAWAPKPSSIVSRRLLTKSSKQPVRRIEPLHTNL